MRNAYKQAEKRSAFTLVELLVVIAIIGVLVALLLPAIQAARESARRTQCQNHLKQFGLASLNYELAQGALPSAGWHWHWMGDPDLGFGKNQPGSWVFSLLPFLEQSNVRSIAKGLPVAEKRVALKTLAETTIQVMNCPSRREAIAYPKFYNDTFANMDKPEFEVRGDYSACMSGQVRPTDNVKDPLSIENALGTGPRGTPSWLKWEGDEKFHDGVICQHSEVEFRQITDGTSSTYLIGEKFLESDHYETGQPTYDDQSYYVGFDRDIVISSYELPLRDAPVGDHPFRFGSAHPTTFYVVFCDGSVHANNFDIDQEIHRSLGSRNAEEIIDLSDR